MSAPPLELNVLLGTRTYPIHIGSGVLAQAQLWRAAIAGRHVLVVSDETVARLYANKISAGFEGKQLSQLTFPPGETSKSLESCAAIFDALARMGANRDTCIVALGGGVVGDLAGFAAACWMRGIDFVQMPTTLLAMVDSSVGGKTGVNLVQGKNLVGAFHQPRAVFIDTDTLATLPDRELRAGFAEVVKYGALGDAEFFTWLETHADALVARDPELIAQAIATCCRQKAAIVARDETEQGERALLNFGHTFGHALETVCGYGTLLHGEAVAIGMVLAARLSALLGMSTSADTERIVTLLTRFNLPTKNPVGTNNSTVVTTMLRDKKNLSGSLRLILWHGIGQARIVPDVHLDSIRMILHAIT